jgi:hypothetical protein
MFLESGSAGTGCDGARAWADHRFCGHWSHRVGEHLEMTPAPEEKA